MKPAIALTLGDPAGVGPEIVARVCHDLEVAEAAHLIVVGQEQLLARGAAFAGVAMPEVELHQVGEPEDIRPGQWSAASGRLAGSFVQAALGLCQDGRTNAMATAPISKEALQAGGYPDTGHTTMLARLTNTPRPVMMLAGDKLRVVLATIHCALSEVFDRLSLRSIVETGMITAVELRDRLSMARPRMAVAGLNPHAGEGGMFGDEEERIIAPAIEALQTAGIDATGPHPPDTVFWRAARGEFDVVLCMYHDQGLIPLKLLHFEDGVNVTLGLGVIRTSVDHGTAYDIAGTGQANPASLKQAILMAARMAIADGGQP